MADVFSAIILDSNYWDGTTSWAGEVSEAARDAKYGARRFTSLIAWETDRDGLAQAADTEYANIFGPWASHDTNELTINGWTNVPTIIIQTIGIDARSQDGKFDSNSCYVLENNSDAECVSINQTGHDITFIGVQFQTTNNNAGKVISQYETITGALTIKKCYFKESSDGGVYAIYSFGNVTAINSVFEGHQRGIQSAGSILYVYNCTITGAEYGLVGQSLDDVVINTAVFDNIDDLLMMETINWCASDQGAGEGTNGLNISATWDTTCFTDQANGDYSIEVDSPLKDASDLSQADDANVPSDDIIGTARNVGAGQTVSIGAYEFVPEIETINLAGILPAMSGSVVRKLMPKRQLAGSI